MVIPTLLQIISPIYSVACTICISLFLASLAWSLWKTSNQGWIYVKRLHQVPCDRCAFFTGEYNLKCTIHPCRALNEKAIDCLDYQSVGVLYSAKNCT